MPDYNNPIHKDVSLEFIVDMLGGEFAQKGLDTILAGPPEFQRVILGVNIGLIWGRLQTESRGRMPGIPDEKVGVISNAALTDLVIVISNLDATELNELISRIPLKVDHPESQN